MSTNKLIVLITGSNQGLGYYAAQQLAATGKYHVLIGSRDLSKAKKAIESLGGDSSVKVDINNLEPIQIDVQSDDSINAAAEYVSNKYGYLDVLMNNAGVAGQEKADEKTTLRQLYQQKFDTNLFGAAVTTEAFLPLLRKSTAPGGKRIAFTSSGLSSLKWASDPEAMYAAKNWPIYRSTKTAMSMIILHYAQVLDSEGFTVSGSDPGYCGTNLNDYGGFKDPRDGAKVLVRAATDDKEKVHGFVVDETTTEPW